MAAEGRPVLPAPPTSPWVRAAGIGAIVGAVLWLLALGSLAAAGLADGVRGPADAATLGRPLSIAGLLLVVALAVLERRATREVRLVDLVADLSIATGVGLFVLATLAGSFAPLGPGLLLFHIGAVLLGVAGADGRRRPRWASVLIGAGGASLLVYLLLGGLLGPDVRAALGQGAFVGQILMAIGWGWLGLHLALGRPLATPPA